MSRTREFLKVMALSVAIMLGANSGLSQPATNVSALHEVSAQYRWKWEKGRGDAYDSLMRSVHPAQTILNRNRDMELMFVTHTGRPVYYMIENLNAARTLSTDDVWPGGSAGYSLTGTGTDYLGIWDAGGVLLTHQEFGGRVVQMDSPSATHYHSTHVAGTMVAAGVDPNAKGMAFQASLDAYDWDYDDSEVAAAAAAGMRVSNHSYGYVTGWYYDYGAGAWYWWGDVTISETEDWAFGFYNEITAAWDNIAYNAPYYMTVKSAGNDRDDAGPGPGGGHYVWQNEQWEWSTTTRDQDGGMDGYDCISYVGIAKNVLAVGAVQDIPGGYTQPSDVVMSGFSGWGPADDGRIKPDIVANGIALYSTDDDANNDYTALSGTSMSSPNVSGSVGLLVQHYQNTHGGATPRASTVKAIVIHTADEAGANSGPDYRFGWGLMNTRKAADVIAEDQANPQTITEDFLSNGQTDSYDFWSDGSEPIRVTIAWTDPPGTPPPPSLNPTTPILVNDLDVRLVSASGPVTFNPYVLDPSNPDNVPATGDNFRDNAEQIYRASLVAGQYTVQVSHKGTLSADQYYSLVVTGLVGLVHDLVISVSGGNAVLRWSDAGSSYRIYGATTPFTSGTLLDTTSDTIWTDTATSSRLSPYFYYVTAQQ
ncbi:MAG: S8 family serine peptidase [bacterium]